MDTLATMFAEQLKQARKERGWDQTTLGRKLSVSRQTIMRWESGERTPDWSALDELASVLDKKIYFRFVDETDDEVDKIQRIASALSPSGKKYVLELLEHLTTAPIK